MKNVIGYDLVKLMVGLCGQFGVLIEVVLKIVLKLFVLVMLVVLGLVMVVVGVLIQVLIGFYDILGVVWLLGQGVLVWVEGFEGLVVICSKVLVEKLGVDFVVCDWVMVLWDVLGDLWCIICCLFEVLCLLVVLFEFLVLDWGGGLIWVVLLFGWMFDLFVWLGYVSCVLGDVVLIFLVLNFVVLCLNVSFCEWFDLCGIFVSDGICR